MRNNVPEPWLLGSEGGGGGARKGSGRWANLEVREVGDGWENGPK